MKENKEIDFLLQGNQRLWDMGAWFEQTADFIVSDLDDMFKNQSIKQSPPEDLRLITKVCNKLFSINSKDFEELNDVKVGIIFFKTKEFLFAEEYLLKSMIVKYVRV